VLGVTMVARELATAIARRCAPARCAWSPARTRRRSPVNTGAGSPVTRPHRSARRGADPAAQGVGDVSRPASSSRRASTTTGVARRARRRARPRVAQAAAGAFITEAHDRRARSVPLDGRVAIVTGSVRGLGARSRRGSRPRRHVVVTSRDAEAAASAAASSARRRPSMSRSRPRSRADLRGRRSPRADRHPRQQRGHTHRAPLESDPRAMDTVVDTTCAAPGCARRPSPGDARRALGRIVNIASMFAAVGMPNRTPYVASKGAWWR